MNGNSEQWLTYLDVGNLWANWLPTHYRSGNSKQWLPYSTLLSRPQSDSKLKSVYHLSDPL